MLDFIVASKRGVLSEAGTTGATSETGDV